MCFVPFLFHHEPIDRFIHDCQTDRLSKIMFVELIGFLIPRFVDEFGERLKATLCTLADFMRITFPTQSELCKIGFGDDLVFWV